MKLSFFAIHSARSHGKGGEALWDMQATKYYFDEVCKPVNNGKNGSDLMTFQRFKEIREYFPKGFENLDRKSQDDWYQIDHLVKGFNESRSKFVAAAIRKVFDESMSQWKPRTTEKGRLPHLSFVLRKPRPLGTEFKTVACAETGQFISLFIFLFYKRNHHI